MKPLVLEISAFGPFAGRERIDFRELGSHTLFLIHGRTGAGKTSILDALCFALFGETTGGEREARAMRSHHAAPDLETEVSLEFALGADLYRVERRPEQDRPKKRGEGTTRSPQAAVLTRLGAEGEESRVLADRWLKVTDEVESILGYSLGEFRQVVVLPQGQFRRLLVADSAERERILETLFRTEHYRAIERALADKARALAGEARDLEARRGALLEQAGSASSEELATKVTDAAAELQAAQSAAKAAGDAAVAAEKALAGAREQAALRRALEEALAAHQKLLAEEERRSAERERLAAMRKAASLESVCAARDRRRAEAAEATRESAEARAAAEQAEADREGAVERLRTLEARGPEIEQLRQRRERLQGCVAAAADIDRMRREIDDAEVVVADARGGIGWAERSISGLEAQRDALLERKQRATALLETIDVRKQDVKAAEEAFRLRRELESLRSLRMKALLERGSAESAEQEALARLKDLRKEQRALEDAWRSGRAAALAAELVEGRPCPVCGSEDHPAPASGDEASPDDSLLEEVRARLDAADAAAEAARKAHAGKEMLVRGQKERIDALERGLGEACESSIEDLGDRLQAARERLAAAGQADVELREVTAKLEATEAGLAEERQALEENREKLAGASAEVARRKGRLEAAEQGVPEELRKPGAVDAALAEVARQLGELERALTAAREAATAAMSEAATARALADQLCRAAERAVAAADQHDSSFAAALGAAGFDDESSFQAARGAGAEMDALEAELERYEVALRSAADRVERAKAAADGVPEDIDVAAAQSRAAGMAAARDAAVAQAARLEQGLKSLGELAESIDEFDERSRRTRETYAVVGRVADVAAGRGANLRGIPFQRFVLAALLDDVLAAASERLRVMSNQRYILRRSEERGSRKVTTGLELLVFDSYTGQERSVATLSGGEGFLASLSLALGLADVVQSYAGGLYLETIFVDEGFGTLDPESLDLAMRALADLQAGGRLVGVISHVPDLRERIAARLEVLAASDGSRTRFVVG